MNEHECSQMFMNLPMFDTIIRCQATFDAIVRCQATFDAIIRCQGDLEFYNPDYVGGTAFAPGTILV